MWSVTVDTLSLIMMNKNNYTIGIRLVIWMMDMLRCQTWQAGFPFYNNYMEVHPWENHPNHRVLPIEDHRRRGFSRKPCFDYRVTPWTKNISFGSHDFPIEDHGQQESLGFKRQTLIITYNYVCFLWNCLKTISEMSGFHSSHHHLACWFTECWLRLWLGSLM